MPRRPAARKGPIRGSVSLVGAGPGDPGLVTLRARERLEAADVVVYDRLVHPAVLGMARADARLIYVGKRRSEHAVPQDEVNDLLIELARTGARVVRLKGGDPFVFGRGGEEADALASAGIEFEIVPGISSAVAVPAYAGVPITDRRAASSVAIVTGHLAPDHPDSNVDWAGLATSVDTVVILMGMTHLSVIARALIAGGRDASTPAVVVEWGTYGKQHTVQADLDSIADAVADANVSAPSVIVVGDVAAMADRLAWFAPGASEISAETSAIAT
jgi:uroporphyrinogen III methyltransferase / synthase